MAVKVCVFDAYGTLFDVASAARNAAEEPGRAALAQVWQPLAADWRAKQLEYTWQRAVTGQHRDFWGVTQDGLDWALERHGLDGNPDLRERLMSLYLELDAYPEVLDVLTRLKHSGKACAILSNGSPDMLSAAVGSAGIADLLDAALSVEEVGVFKPARPVYDLVGTRFGCQPEEVLFVSSNGWDAAAAGSYGFITAWANRANLPVDRLPALPRHVLPDLTRIPEIADA